MSVVVVNSRALTGVVAPAVAVEVHVTGGLPQPTCVQEELERAIQAARIVGDECTVCITVSSKQGI